MWCLPACSRASKRTAGGLRLLLLALCACCLLYYVLLARSSATFLRLQQRNGSLTQAAALSRQLRELSLKQSSPRTLQSAFSTAGRLISNTEHAPSGGLPVDTTQHADSHLLHAKVMQIVASLSAAKPVVLCNLDQTLLQQASSKRQHVLLAGNMHNNEDLLPHFTLQMLSLLSSLPVGSAFLSIYESGSTDSTGQAVIFCTQCLGPHLHVLKIHRCCRQMSQFCFSCSHVVCYAGAWLEVLQDLMVCLGVPHRIIIGDLLTIPQLQAFTSMT